MMLAKAFAALLALAVLGTSVWMYVAGGRFQAVEARAYAGARRPWWFVLALVAYALLYLAALAAFVAAPERSWAAWVLIVVIPVVAVLKGALVVFNRRGQTVVTSTEGDAAWRRIALSRVVLVPLFLLLAYYA
jgi:hypothetical protein